MIRSVRSGLRGRFLSALAVAALAATFVVSDAQAQRRKPAPAKEKETPSKTQTSGKPTGNDPVQLGTFGEWGAYSAGTGKAKTCYALGKPRERQPSKLKRDPAYIFISNRPGEGVRNEVSIVMGFDVKPDSTPSADIAGVDFEMAPKGANLWVKNAAREGQFVDALRKGQRLTVKAPSKKGNLTTDTYVLAGLAQALDRIGRECQ